MSDDEKLPAKRTEPLPPASETPGYLTTPAARRNWFGRTFGRLLHDHRARTIRSATNEVDATRENLKALEDLHIQAGRTARAVDDFHYATPRIIANDRANTDHSMAEASIRRQIEAEESAQRLAEAKARGQRGRVQGDYDDQIAVFNNEEKLADARMRAERAQWGLDAFRRSMPFRRDRIEHLYKTGALNAELDRIILESERDAQLRQGAARDGSDGLDAQGAVFEQMLAELNQEIENAHATHAGDEVLAALHSFRAKVSARLKR